MDRRTFLRTTGILTTASLSCVARAASIVAVRMWPADDYTRITLESDTKLSYVQKTLIAPHRLFVDIQGIGLTPTLRSLTDKLQASDPNVAGIRFGMQANHTVRVVIDLKQPIKPQIFTLQPIANYQHRLVFDLYPKNAPDPLEQLIAQHSQAPAPSPSGDVLGDWIAGTQTGASNHVESHAHTDVLGDFLAQKSTPSKPTPKPAPKPAPKPSKRKAKRLIIVAIDAGHGGEDPGAVGPRGTREKDIVLRIAKKLAARVNASSINGNPMRAYMTRNGDYFVPLGTRVAKARRVKADLFISIHADAFTRPQANGASVYALSRKGASSASARWLAKKENSADLIGGLNIKKHRDASVQRALLHMSTTAQIRDSLILGKSMLGEIGKINRLHKRHVGQAGFAVLKAPDIPSVLVETAFISNPKEELKLRTNTYQNKMAKSIMQGIKVYFRKNPPTPRSRSV